MLAVRRVHAHREFFRLAVDEARAVFALAARTLTYAARAEPKKPHAQ
jgi:hypothetical protein